MSETTRIARIAHGTALEGRGEELAALLLEVAEGMRAVDGCELYIINRRPDRPDEVWVTELWADREAMEGALRTPVAQETIPKVMALVAEWAPPVDLVPLGGPGLP